MGGDNGGHGVNGVVWLSSITESLFWGTKGGGADLHLGGGGGQGDGIAMISPITFIVHSQKSNGRTMGGPWSEWGGGHGPQAPRSYAIVMAPSHPSYATDSPIQT